MSTAELPNPVVRVPDPPEIDTDALATALRDRIEGEVRFDSGTHAANFRQTAVPLPPDAAELPHPVVRVPEPADTEALATDFRQAVMPPSPDAAAEHAVEEGR